MAYSTVPITGTYVSLDGTPARGSVSFTGKAVVIAGTDRKVIPPYRVKAQLDANGSFSIEIPATDDPDVLPNAWTYSVTESLDNGGGRSFELDVPLALAGTGIDLSTVAPADESSGDPTAFVTLTALQDPENIPDLSATYAKWNVNIRGLRPAPLTAATATVRGATDPRPIEVFDGYAWGVSGNDNDIYRSDDEGATWELYHDAFPISGGNLFRLLPTTDGEIVALASPAIYKSSGWGTDSITWSLKVSANGTADFQPWGIDGDGTKFVTTQYGPGESAYPDSRYVHISVDAGNTWAVKYDSVDMHGAALADASHLHAACYDSYGDRFYISEGHGTDIAGIYCSEDDGETWVRAAGMIQNPAPTAIVATEAGLVCGSDNAANGLYGIRRGPVESQVLHQTWSWRTAEAGLVGFARRGFRQPDTDVVYFTFTANVAGLAPIIAAGTVESGALVYSWPLTVDTTLANDYMGQVILPARDKVLADARINGNSYYVTAVAAPPGASSVIDTGSLFGGDAQGASSVAVGPSSVAKELRNVAIGTLASSGSQDSTVIGYNANSLGANTVMIGANATGAAQDVCIGMDSDSGTSGACVAIGRAATVTAGGGQCVAIGESATTTGGNSTAIGQSATAASTGTAIGQDSTALGNSIAIGKGTTTTNNNQVNFGVRHLELPELGALEPSAFGLTNGLRIYARDNGAGKTQLCVRFPTGDVQVLATQA